ncbi:MAG: type II toxin-antitoxin system VapC family toxin [Opitutales bacterium]
MNHFLDTTALVAHALAEAGGSEAQALIANEEHEFFISPLSLFELASVLKQNGSIEYIPIYWETYRQVAEVIPVDAALAESAWDLREKIGKRIPIADAIIASASKLVEATLVHRDPHLAQIPNSLILRIHLPHSKNL